MHALRPHLEYLCDKVEAILATHHAPGRIGGGTASEERIQLFFEPGPHIQAATVLALLPVLSAGLGTPVDGRRGESGVILTLKTPAALPGRRAMLGLEVTHERQAD